MALFPVGLLVVSVRLVTAGLKLVMTLPETSYRVREFTPENATPFVCAPAMARVRKVRDPGLMRMLPLVPVFPPTENVAVNVYEPVDPLYVMRRAVRLATPLEKSVFWFKTLFLALPKPEIVYGAGALPLVTVTLFAEASKLTTVLLEMSWDVIVLMPVKLVLFTWGALRTTAK